MKNTRRTLKIWAGIALVFCLLGTMATSVFAAEKWTDTLTGFSIKVNGTSFASAGNSVYTFDEATTAFNLSDPSITTYFSIDRTSYNLAYSFSESGPYTFLGLVYNDEHSYTNSFNVTGQDTIFLKITLAFNENSSLTIALARAQAAPPPTSKPEPASSSVQPVASYRVMYDVNYGNLGTTQIDDQTGYLAGQTVTLRPETPTRAGYTFVAWNTAANGGGTPYKPGNQVELHADTRLYAQWKKSVAASSAVAPAASEAASSGAASSGAASSGAASSSPAASEAAGQSEAASVPASSAGALPSQPAAYSTAAGQATGNGGGSIFPWWVAALVVLAGGAIVWLFAKKAKKRK